MSILIDISDKELSNILESIRKQLNNYTSNINDYTNNELSLIMLFNHYFSNRNNYLGYYLAHKEDILSNLKLIYPQINEDLSYIDHSKLICILNYLILVFKYKDSYNNLPFNYQLDIVFAISKNNVSYTQFKNIIPLLLNKEIMTFYNKIETDFPKYIILEDLLSIDNGPTEFNIRYAIKIMQEYILPKERPAVDEEFSIDNLYLFFSDLQRTSKNSGMNTFYENYDFSQILEIKKLNKGSQEEYLNLIKDIFESVMPLFNKVKIIMMITAERIEKGNNIININFSKKG